MPPCLHASSVVQTRRGFTLSELLVSLAVLGLISALTLPSIFNSVSAAQLKAKQTETIQVLQDVMYQGFMNGDFAGFTDWTFENTSDPLVQYFSGKLAGATHCPMNTTTPPCTHSWTSLGSSHTNNNHSGRWVLPNGVGVWFWTQPNVSSSTIGWLIDGNMSNTTSTWHVVGADQLALRCNISSTNQTWVTNLPAKPGQCTAWDNSHQIAISALYQ
ncbi:MAG: type II secretion system protein [Vampirovibrionales bacterium]